MDFHLFIHIRECKNKKVLMKIDIKNKKDEELFEMLMQNKKIAAVAFDELYERYSNRIFTYCRKFLNNQQNAEDAFQEVFIKVYESSTSVKKMTHFGAFIYKIAHNICINFIANKEAEVKNLKHEDIPYEETNMDNQQIEDIVNLCVNNLPEEYKEVLILKEYMDMKYVDIADTLNISLSNVKTRIYRAKDLLKTALEPFAKELRNYQQ